MSGRVRTSVYEERKPANQALRALVATNLYIQWEESGKNLQKIYMLIRSLAGAVKVFLKIFLFKNPALPLNICPGEPNKNLTPCRFGKIEGIVCILPDFSGVGARPETLFP